LSDRIEWVRFDSDKVRLGWDSGDTNWGGLNELLVVVLVVVLLVGLILNKKKG
jgi:hypothetical protein